MDESFTLENKIDYVERLATSTDASLTHFAMQYFKKLPAHKELTAKELASVETLLEKYNR